MPNVLPDPPRQSPATKRTAAALSGANISQRSFVFLERDQNEAERLRVADRRAKRDAYMENENLKIKENMRMEMETALEVTKQEERKYC